MNNYYNYCKIFQDELSKASNWFEIFQIACRNKGITIEVAANNIIGIRTWDSLRPQTPSATEAQNEKDVFDFLSEKDGNQEKPIFNGGSSGELVPLDFNEKI